MVRRFFLTFLLIFVTLSPLASQESQWTVKLMVLGPGPELYAWWGHTGIIMENRENRRSYFYDFGNFSFETDNFYRNFAMGRLIYEGVKMPSPLYLNYTATLNRDLKVYTLDISDENAQELFFTLEKMISPEHSKYLYDHFEDNCSTRIRDYLDQALEGRLREISEDQMVGTFRSQFRRFSHSYTALDLLLNYLQGSYPDREISQWDAMYLPTELEIALEELHLQDGVILERKILSEAGDHLPVIPDRAPPAWPQSLLAGLFLMTAFFFLDYFPGKGREKRHRLIWWTSALTAALPGTMLFLMTLFTDHHVTFHNLNLLISSPLLLLLGIFNTPRNKLSGWIRRGLTWGVTALTVLSIGLQFFPFWKQENLAVLLFFLPQYGYLCWIIYREEHRHYRF